MKSIVAATDLSERGNLALQRGIYLASQMRLPLRILHVVDEELPTSIRESLQEEAVGVIEQALAGLEKPAGTPIDIVQGRGSSTIRQYAQEHEAACIVVGRHRETTFMDMLRGSTIERLLRHGDRPLFITKQPPKNTYSRILIAVDFSPHSRRAVEFALHSFPTAEYCLTHAFEPPFSAFMVGDESMQSPGDRHEREMRQIIHDELRTFISTFDISTRPLNLRVQPGQPLQVIKEELGRFKADLLVVGTHGRRGIAHALLGSVAESLLKGVECDVAAVRAF